MDKLQEIKKNLEYGKDIEGLFYDYKSLNRSDIYWMIQEIEKLRGYEFYRMHGMTIYIKGELIIGIHPNNLANNLYNLSTGNMTFDWGMMALKSGIDINKLPINTNVKEFDSQNYLKEGK